jgi:hypothetical protein
MMALFSHRAATIESVGWSRGSETSATRIEAGRKRAGTQGRVNLA